MNTYEWISLAQTVIMAAAGVLIWTVQRSAKIDSNNHDLLNRVGKNEAEIQRLRDWRHNDIVVWQQTLWDKVEERFVTRREWEESRRGTDDSPFPRNRKR